MTSVTRYARATDGTHVAYQVDGEGPLDILVMRAWHSNIEHDWEEPILTGVFRRLGSLGRVVRLDRRGTGLSDPVETDELPTLEYRVDDMRAVLDAIRSERVVLVGLAHGAALCSVFAATYPERTAGLVIWAPPFALVGQADQGLVDAWAAAVGERWGTEELAREIVEGAAPSRANDSAFVEWIRQDQLVSGSASDAVRQWQLVAQTNVDAILPTVHVPTAVLWRTGSPSSARYVAERIPNARAIELPGDDHVLISAAWRPALREIEGFIESLDGVEPERDRVLASVMFTDIVGSTERAAALGDARWLELVERHHAAVRRELARYRGREIDTAGDGFFATFDAPARAIRCALAIREAVASHGLALRIGVHVGECERVGSGLRGLAVHIGARVAASAEPGEILVTRTVKDLVAGAAITFEEAGTRTFRGVPDEWQIFRVAVLG